MTREATHVYVRAQHTLRSAEELNTKYGIPQSVRFDTNEHGMIKTVLTHYNGGCAVIALMAPTLFCQGYICTPAAQSMVKRIVACACRLHSSAEVYLFGASVTSWCQPSGDEVRVLTLY